MGLMLVRRAQPRDERPLAKMRAELWPDSSASEHQGEIRQILSGVSPSTLPLVIFVAEEEGRLLGFAEVGLRSHAGGCDPVRPVGYLEGWFVRAEARGKGVGHALSDAAEKWALTQGCTEMASDTWADSEKSRSIHNKLGYEVVNIGINFRKSILKA